jgi:GH15 family glucan-1,4-alpha-glucosidase
MHARSDMHAPRRVHAYSVNSLSIPMQQPDHRYPPIADYALISDCHGAALISRNGSIDWCCMPRVDSDSCFGRILDWDKGGYYLIAPADDGSAMARRYLPGTMVLETHFKTAQGEVKLYDFFVMDANAEEMTRYNLVRVVEGVAGTVDMRVEIRPRFDYGDIRPAMRGHDHNTYSATGSNKGLIIYSDRKLDVIDNHDLEGCFTISAGQRLRLLVHFESPELIEDALQRRVLDGVDADGGLQRTCDWWNAWSGRMHWPYQFDEQSMRSAIVLKSLTYERTGAIVAAPTASLPEMIGGTRNWDYRFSWVRDSVFTLRALYQLGCYGEADSFLRFVQRSCAGSASELQIMYGVDGKRRLTEIEIDWLEGYRGSQPVRIGNDAARQNQLDIYGEVMELAWEWRAGEREIDGHYWDFLVDVVNTVSTEWHKQDHGIWEFRGGPRHYVHSKAMCWSAVNYGVMLAERDNRDAPVERWKQLRTSIREAIETKGYDGKRGVFVQAFDSENLDAALLLLPRIGFVAYDDPRMVRTVDAIRQTLDRNGLLARYNSPDGLPGDEGVFLPCTFWLVSCLALQGRVDDAWRYYHRARGCANDVGLFSEEFSINSNEMLGNFPQGLTHVSQIMARLALGKAGNTVVSAEQD